MKLLCALSNVLFMLIVVVATATLSGCFATTKVVTRTVTLYQEVPAELTVQISGKVPINKVVYLTMPLYERERYLSDYSIDLLKSLSSCNAQLNGVAVLSSQWKANNSQPTSP